MSIVPIPSSPPDSVRSLLLSWSRTAVPTAWGIVITFLATRAPAVAQLLDNPAVYAVVDGAVTLVWYGFFRWVEKHLPAWLTRFVLGANTAPAYPAVPPAANQPVP